MDQEIKFERELRHVGARHSSDFKHLKECIREAAARFDDIADLLEKKNNYNPIDFIRASAKRYRAEADG